MNFHFLLIYQNIFHYRTSIKDFLDVLDRFKNNLIVTLFVSSAILDLSLFNQLRFELFTHNTLSLLGI